MNKKEFLDILYEQLSGQMPEGNVAAHVQYYRNYIEEEQRKERSEDDILNELGDPRLIARTLLDTDSTASGNPQTTGSYSEPYTDNSYELSCFFYPTFYPVFYENLIFQSLFLPHHVW